MALSSRWSLTILSLTLAGCLVIGGTSPTLAATKHSSKHSSSTHKTVSTGSSDVRSAQQRLKNLGFYHGKVDGKMGPQTKAAIKSFQRSYGLKVTGTLTPTTRSALGKMDVGNSPLSTGHGLSSPSPMSSYRDSAPASETIPPSLGSNFYGDAHQTYADPMQHGAPKVPSRYGRVDVMETMQGSSRLYDIWVDSQSILKFDNQPTVIHLTRTFELNNEDAIVITSYRDQSTLCPYRHTLLVLTGNGPRLHDIENCTFDLTAQVKNGSLYIKFPETEANRAVESTWRYEAGRLEKL